MSISSRIRVSIHITILPLSSLPNLSYGKPQSWASRIHSRARSDPGPGALGPAHAAKRQSGSPKKTQNHRTTQAVRQVQALRKQRERRDASKGDDEVLEGNKGVPRNGGRKRQLARSCFALDSLGVQTLMSTDAQTPFLGAPLVPLEEVKRRRAAASRLAGEVATFWRGCRRAAQISEGISEAAASRRRRDEGLEAIVAKTEALSKGLSWQMLASSPREDETEEEPAEEEEESEEDEDTSESEEAEEAGEKPPAEAAAGAGSEERAHCPEAGI